MPTRPASREAPRALSRLLLALVAAAAGVHLALRFLPVPWAWILAAAAVGLLAWRRSAARAGLGMAAVGLAWSLGALAIVELGLGVSTGRAGRGVVHEPDPVRLDARFGTAGEPDARIVSTRFDEDGIVYRASYSLDALGLRAGPPAPAREPEACVLFYGGSFTFGEGVEDHEALPYRVEWQSGGRFHGANLGFLGHGAHQMLARLEHRHEAELAGCEPRAAVYQARVDHVRSALGRHTGDLRGPRYAIAADDRLEARGFYENGSAADWRLGYGHWALGRSEIARRARASASIRVEPQDVRLYAAIVDRARRVFEARHPGARFHVLFWDEPLEPQAQEVRQALEATGVRVHRVGDVLDGYRVDPWLWTLAPNVAQPNPEAYEELALYVRREILAETALPEGG